MLAKKNNRREFFFNDTVCILKECLCNLHNSRHGASWEYRSQTKSNSFIKTHKLFTLFGRTFGRATFAIRCKYSSDIPLPMRVALRAHERHTSPLPSILLEKQTIKKLRQLECLDYSSSKLSELLQQCRPSVYALFVINIEDCCNLNFQNDILADQHYVKEKQINVNFAT